MIQIVVADDEKLIRAGISKILKTSISIPLDILEAKNGAEALEIIKNEQPQVLITDIRMPIMDGVELMKNVSKLENKPNMIVLSGFDDFIYAKSAIENGAHSYILKPVDKKELVTAVEQAISEFKQTEKKKTEETLKNIITEGRIDKTTEISDSDFKNGYYCLNIVGPQCKNAIVQALDSVNYYSLESKKNFESLLIPREAEYLIESDFSLSQYNIGISAGSSNISSLRFYKKQAFQALLQVFFEHKKGIYHFGTENTEDFSALNDKFERCCAKLPLAQPEEIQKEITNLFTFESDSAKKNADKLYFLYSKITENLFSRYASVSDKDLYLHLKGIMIENIVQFNTIEEWLKNVIDYAIYLSELLKKDNTEYPFIDEALVYVKENFTKNINMAMVANHVSINYTWFSEKFKEHMGMNFNEYLKRLRIEEACRLLEKDCYKVYEVSERSGFGDVKYFMKIFKEATGLSPTEWKKQHLTDN
ncbi:MAG: response regulator [Treponema sp.]|nr:response regulator [Treponema sp.]MDY5122693.1 response regulator [Treponema sp.]